MFQTKEGGQEGRWFEKSFVRCEEMGKMRHGMENKSTDFRITGEVGGSMGR